MLGQAFLNSSYAFSLAAISFWHAIVAVIFVAVYFSLCIALNATTIHGAGRGATYELLCLLSNSCQTKYLADARNHRSDSTDSISVVMTVSASTVGFCLFWAILVVPFASGVSYMELLRNVLRKHFGVFRITIYPTVLFCFLTMLGSFLTLFLSFILQSLKGKRSIIRWASGKDCEDEEWGFGQVIALLVWISFLYDSTVAIRGQLKLSQRE